MNKRLLLIGTATLFILGACGNKGEEAKNSTSNGATEVTANENELILDIDGTKKTVAATPEKLDDTIDIKLTSNYKVQQYDSGDIVIGTGEMEGAGFNITQFEDNGADEKFLPKIHAEEEAMSEGGENVEELDLSKYDGLSSKYDAASTSETPDRKRYAFVKVNKRMVTLVSANIPLDKVSSETEAELFSIISSIEFN